MDLETYSSRYDGETRLQRLVLIGQMTPDETVAQQAFDLAEQQMRQDGNVKRYKDIFIPKTSGSTNNNNNNNNIAAAAGSSSAEQPPEVHPPPPGPALAVVQEIPEEQHHQQQQSSGASWPLSGEYRLEFNNNMHFQSSSLYLTYHFFFFRLSFSIHANHRCFDFSTWSAQSQTIRFGLD